MHECPSLTHLITIHFLFPLKISLHFVSFKNPSFLPQIDQRFLRPRSPLKASCRRRRLNLLNLQGFFFLLLLLLWLLLRLCLQTTIYTVNFDSIFQDKTPEIRTVIVSCFHTTENTKGKLETALGVGEKMKINWFFWGFAVCTYVLTYGVLSFFLPAPHKAIILTKNIY